MIVEPLNMRTIKGSVRGVAQYVQDEKIQISRRTITAEQYRERWPDEYNSFVSSETRRNLYKEPEKFFRVMSRSPELYARRFIFRPRLDAGKVMKEAVLYANRLAHEQSQKYGVLSGHYGSSFLVKIGGAALASVSQLDSLNNDSIVTMTNTAEYAAQIETNAVSFARIGGVLFYVAQMVQRKFPALGVQFYFTSGGNVPEAPHYYSTPVLKFGSRDKVVDRIRRPRKKRRNRPRNRRRLR